MKIFLSMEKTNLKKKKARKRGSLTHSVVGHVGKSGGRRRMKGKVKNLNGNLLLRDASP